MVCLSVDIVMFTELHAYDFVIKKGCYLCWTLYIRSQSRLKKGSLLQGPVLSHVENKLAFTEHLYWV